MEYLFVVENKEDPAHESISQLMHDLEVLLDSHLHLFTVFSSRLSRIQNCSSGSSSYFRAWACHILLNTAGFIRLSTVTTLISEAS